MRIQLIPFNNIHGVADIATGEIFLNHSRILSGNGEDDFIHELAHINSADPDHGSEFRDIVAELGGTQPPDDDTFKSLRKRLGLHKQMNKCSCNVGNVTGIQNILTDLHLLASYRRFSKKILSTEGHWEVINESKDGGPCEQLIRLYPTPKGSYPVVVMYYPVVTHFRSPQARKLCMDMALAEAKQVLGASRRKIVGLPTPDGGSVQYDGDSLVQEGIKEADEIILKALQLGEPDRVFCW